MGKRVVFVSRVSKTGPKLFITVPKRYHDMIKHGTVCIVTLEVIEGVE